MGTLKTSHLSLCSCFLLCACVFTINIHATGTIEGDVINQATKTILENARITVSNTPLTTQTDENGHFVISGVPAGKQTLVAIFSGFKTASVDVVIEDGKISVADIAMFYAEDRQGDLVQLEKYTVLAERLTAETAALNEQRMSVALKNVVAFEEFGEMGDGNAGEFLKFVPGVSIEMGPHVPFTASVRGLPSNATLVMVDGSEIASSAGDRSFELSASETENINRLEVTKVPTPDMPANSIGGAINIIGKSGFNSRTSSLKYNVYFTANFLDDPATFTPAPDRKRYGINTKSTDHSINPNASLTYSLPLSRSFAITVNASYSKRYYPMQYNYKLWNYALRKYYGFQTTFSDVVIPKKLASIAVDWKPSRFSTLRASAQYSTDDSVVQGTSLGGNVGTPTAGTMNETENAAAVGTMTWSTYSGIYYRTNQVYKLLYKYDNSTWKIEAEGSYSSSNRESDDEKDHFPGAINATITKLYMKISGFDRIMNGYAPDIYASTAKNGPSINAYDAGLATLMAVSKYTRDITNTIKNARINVARKFNIGIPTEIKIGSAIMENHLDWRQPIRGWAARSPTRTIAYDNAIAQDFSDQTKWLFRDGSRVPSTWIDTNRVDEVINNPARFTMNTATAHRYRCTGSRELTETIASGFLRIDHRMKNNRVHIAYGVRYERTMTDGLGPTDDVTQTYVRDASGNIIYDGAAPNQKPRIKPGLTSLQQMQLRYTERTAKGKGEYGNFFPSVNISYTLTKNSLLRIAYAKTIARPPMTNITPGIIIEEPSYQADDDAPDPDDPTYSMKSRITINDPELKPWTANNFDISYEVYDVKGITFNISAFRKDIKNFFTLFTMRGTPEILEKYGIDPEFEGSRINKYENVGNGYVTGMEWSYRQQLYFLPHWARGVQIYANATYMRLAGNRADDFPGFNPRIINYGIGITRPKFTARFNVSMRDRVYTRMTAATSALPGGARVYVAPQTIADISLKYSFSKRYSAYCSVRNLFFSTKRTEQPANQADGSPLEARDWFEQRTGAQVTLGLMGTF